MSPIAKPLPPVIETAFKIKSIIEKIITTVLPHLLPLNRAPEMINESIARITNIAAMKPPIADTITPNMEWPPMLAIAPIATAPMTSIIPAINSKIARMVTPVGLDIIGEMVCSVEVGFPHFGQKLLSEASSAPQY